MTHNVRLKSHTHTHTHTHLTEEKKKAIIDYYILYNIKKF